MKKSDYLKWDAYFMGIALLSAERSKDPHTSVGACIVSEDNKILSVGYNGMPRGCSDDEYPWDRNSENELDAKYLYVCHAELNALLNYTGTNMTHAKIQAGISEVIYLCDKYAETPSVIAAKRMMKSAGVRYTPYHPANKKIQLDL